MQSSLLPTAPKYELEDATVQFAVNMVPRCDACNNNVSGATVVHVSETTSEKGIQRHSRYVCPECVESIKCDKGTWLLGRLIHTIELLSKKDKPSFAAVKQQDVVNAKPTTSRSGGRNVDLDKLRKRSCPYPSQQKQSVSDNTMVVTGPYHLPAHMKGSRTLRDRQDIGLNKLHDQTTLDDDDCVMAMVKKQCVTFCNPKFLQQPKAQEATIVPPTPQEEQQEPEEQELEEQEPEEQKNQQAPAPETSQQLVGLNRLHTPSHLDPDRVDDFMRVEEQTIQNDSNVVIEQQQPQDPEPVKSHVIITAICPLVTELREALQSALNSAPSKQSCDVSAECVAMKKRVQVLCVFLKEVQISFIVNTQNDPWVERDKQRLHQWITNIHVMFNFFEKYGPQVAVDRSEFADINAKTELLKRYSHITENLF